MKVFFCLFALVAAASAYGPAIAGHGAGWNSGWAGNGAGWGGYNGIGLAKGGAGACWGLGGGLGWKGAGPVIAPAGLAHGPIGHGPIIPAGRIIAAPAIAAGPVYAAGPAIHAGPIGYGGHGIGAHGWNSGKGLW